MEIQEAPIKEQTARYWTGRVAQFSALRQQEFQGEKHRQWIDELERLLPPGKNLRILDAGTGTGFFAFLLAAQGHRVTGIDLTEDMIREARRLGRELGLEAEFLVMDGEDPAFPDGTFDAVVTRNLTWNLPDLPRAYRSWHRILKPGGVLVNFDGDYCREQAPLTLPEHHAHRDMAPEQVDQYRRLKQALLPTQQPRPQWDVELLRQAGFRDILVDTGVWQRVYGRVDNFYNPTPIFAIRAYA